MGILKIDDVEKKEIITEEPVKEKKNLDESALMSMFSKEAIKIAEDNINNISQILLGGGLTYTFSDKDTGINGLSFGFRTLTAGEENTINHLVRMQGWDSNPSRVSFNLVTFENVVHSMISYNDFNMANSPADEKRKRLSKVPSFIMENIIFPRYHFFMEALSILSNPEVYDFLLKKSFPTKNQG